MTVNQILVELTQINSDLLYCNGDLRGECSTYLYGRFTALMRMIQQDSAARSITVNLNEMVKIELLDRGKEILEKDEVHSGRTPDADGKMTMQLHEVMRIFGQEIKPFLVRPIGMNIEVIRT